MESSGKKYFNSLFFKTIFVFWISWGVFGISFALKTSYGNYRFLSRLSVDERRVVVPGEDFYHFLMFCDKVIPKGKDLKWIFPDGKFLGNSEYCFFRAYYYLYPRNYRENANYIIVYGREKYNKPSDYEIFAEYCKDAYILSRKELIGKPKK